MFRKYVYAKEIAMKIKRLLCVMLALMMVAVIMASCKKDEVKKTSAGISSEAELSYLDHIEFEDMDGYNFRMFVRPGSGMMEDQYVEVETGDIINDAVYRRNELVKQLFNIEISAIKSDATKADDATNTILAGDDQYDIILPHSRAAFSYAVQNTLVDFNQVSTIDTTKPWWSQDLIDSCEVNGHLYVLDGDIQTHRLEYAFAMYFNKRIFDELGLEYPYQLALNGEWTFDEFSKLVKQGSKDISGDGVINPDDDQYGYYTWPAYGPIQVLYSGGQRIYSKNSQNIPYLSLNSAKTVEIFSKYFDLCDSDDVYLKPSSVSVKEDLFTAGRAMFADKDLGRAKTMRSMNDDFGILPWPKFTSDDEYCTVINGHASLVVMPITVPDYERTGKIIEALCAVGNKNVIPAFYDVSLKTKFSRDYESEKMIDIIRDSLVYDLGYISGGTFQSCGSTLADMSNPDFASYYASNESRALTDLQNFLKAYGKMG